MSLCLVRSAAKLCMHTVVIAAVVELLDLPIPASSRSQMLPPALFVLLEPTPALQVVVGDFQAEINTSALSPVQA